MGFAVAGEGVYEGDEIGGSVDCHGCQSQCY